VSRYQKGKTNLDFTEATDSEWQWNPLGHMQVCTLLQTDNHASTRRSVFTGQMPFLPPTNSVNSVIYFVQKLHDNYSESKGRFFLQNKCIQIDSHNGSNHINSNHELECSTRVSQYQKGKTNLDFTEARDSDWQWHQLGS